MTTYPSYSTVKKSRSSFKTALLKCNEMTKSMAKREIEGYDRGYVEGQGFLWSSIVKRELFHARKHYSVVWDTLSQSWRACSRESGFIS